MIKLMKEKKPTNFLTLIAQGLTHKSENTSYNIVMLNEDPNTNPVKRSLSSNIT
jgi:hypothetical protein